MKDDPQATVELEGPPEEPRSASAGELPEQFDGYRIVRLIGEGAMGKVYLGFDTLIHRPVAVKLIASSEPGSEGRQRFLNEARAVARLQHPCVVTIYRAGEVAGHPYIVSEYVEGDCLDSVARPMPWKKVLQIGYELARGLSVAHQAGIVHRDVKAANVMLGADGAVKLLDFGIAMLLGDAAHPTPGTRSRSIAGTPVYMAPEVWEGLSATYASDVYSLGVLLFLLCADRLPRTAPTLAELREVVIEGTAVCLREAVPDVDPTFAAIVDRCLCRDPLERFCSGEEVRAALSRLVFATRTEIVPEGNPYRGLRPFEAEHQPFYFGRNSEIRTILERLQGSSAVVVVGDSGVGKSSLCRSGVIPRLQDALEESRKWSVATVVPGIHPVGALCSEVGILIGVAPESLRSLLDEGADTLKREICRALGEQRGLVLFVDQLEELVTTADAAQAEQFCRLLSRLAVATPGLKLLATIRGDFLSRFASSPAVGDSFDRSLFFLRPLSAERVREAVEGPARVKGFAFESDEMIASLVDSTVDAGGALPLLQFALSILWQERDDQRRVIPAAALERIGGVGGALGMHADEILARMSRDQRTAAREILTRLVSADGTRAIASMEDLDGSHPEAPATLRTLVEGRLVSVRETPEGTGYEVSHEALLKGWSTLAGWIAADEDLRVVREQLARSRAEWERLGRPDDALWGARQLAETLTVDVRSLAQADRLFLRRSGRVVRRNRVLIRGLAIGVPLLVVMIVGASRLQAHLETRQIVRSHIELSAGEIEKSARLGRDIEDLESTAYALFDGGQMEVAEKEWMDVHRLRREKVVALGRAGQSLELALARDPSSVEARALLADVLLERALLAESTQDADMVVETLLRLEAYDVDGSRAARFHEPGRVVLVVDPEPDRVVLERYRRSDDGRLVPSVMDARRAVLASGMELEPGSYRIAVGWADGREVLYPFTIQRGEKLDVDLEAPPVEAMRPGYVYVPPGRFLFGTARDDGIRQGFMHTVPIHTVKTGGYLIARHETTFAEWITYLESMPAQERASHSPSVQVGGFEGALKLEQPDEGGWRLTFEPTVVSYTATTHETIVYEGRKTLKEQDWSRFPVVGISAADAREYTRWLDASGRIPGARLCTELEWERAARGADDRPFPHGWSLAPEHANFDATHGKHPPAMGPDEVGSHPLSMSPFGLDDMSGNVWEWTVCVLGDSEHVARGGSFYFDLNSARVSNREVPEPSFRDVSVGLRVCADISPAS